MKQQPTTKPVSPARVEALKVLLRVERDGAFASSLLASERMLALSPEDRRLAHEIALGVLRWRGHLDYLVNAATGKPAEKLDLIVRAALWMGLYQLRFLERIPDHAAVSESVALVKNSGSWRAAPLVNAALRASIRGAFTAPDDRVRDPLNRQSIALSHPRWMLARWVEQFGEEETEAIARADNQHPPVALRVNALRAPSLARVLEDLDEQGVSLRESTVAPGAFVVERGHIGPRSTTLQKGWI